MHFFTLWNLSFDDIYTINFLILKPSRIFDINHAFRSREPSSCQPNFVEIGFYRYDCRTFLTNEHFFRKAADIFSFKTLNKIINMAFDKKKWYDSSHMQHMICININQIGHVVVSYIMFSASSLSMNHGSAEGS